VAWVTWIIDVVPGRVATGVTRPWVLILLCQRGRVF
jgi:hypothetical protein